MTVRIINADVTEGLRQLADESVHCVVTSPPYWGLRDYGVEGQLGLEPTLGEHLDALVAMFRDVRRVLREDGTLWLNYGDCYAGSWSGNSMRPNGGSQREGGPGFQPLDERVPARNGGVPAGLKPKDLCGVPWRLALALQADGWWLRQDIIWSKPNPMPESTKDRCTKAHEYLFLLTKAERYYFDAEAIAEDASYDADDTKFPDGWDTSPGGHGSRHRKGREKGKRVRRTKDNDEASRNPNSRPHNLSGFEAKNGRNYPTRNKRSVWTVATQPYPEAHFATFPPELIEPCIKAGCRPGGTVLDPFGGSGTTGLVADRLGRDAILIELNKDYAEMAERRISGDAPMFTQVEVA